MSQQGHSPPFWEHGGFVLQKHTRPVLSREAIFGRPDDPSDVTLTCACNFNFSFCVDLGKPWAAIRKEESGI